MGSNFGFETSATSDVRYSTACAGVCLGHQQGSGNVTQTLAVEPEAAQPEATLEWAWDSTDCAPPCMPEGDVLTLDESGRQSRPSSLKLSFVPGEQTSQPDTRTLGRCVRCRELEVCRALPPSRRQILQCVKQHRLCRQEHFVGARSESHQASCRHRRVGICVPGANHAEEIPLPLAAPLEDALRHLDGRALTGGGRRSDLLDQVVEGAQRGVTAGQQPLNFRLKRARTNIRFPSPVTRSP